MEAVITKTQNRVISTEWEVKIDLTPEEATELAKALAIVQKYERKALRKVKTYRKRKSSDDGADWVMVEYAVKKDSVYITVEAGMAG